MESAADSKPLEPVVNESTTLPDYIDFLLSPDTPLDFHVNVGNPELCVQERIGAVKWFLIARSKVLRLILMETKMRDTKEMSITDLDSDTFKNFLVFMYGYDNTSSLTFNAAVSLLCAADTYDVADLTCKLDEVIAPQVTVDNVFVILEERLACKKVPKVWKNTTEIIQCHTEALFSHAQFPTVNSGVLLNIVQQDTLSVPEVEVWRAALNWATHQAQPVDGVISAENLRMTILPLLKHIRLCTMSTDHLVKEVFVTKILTSPEIGEISLSVAGNRESCSSSDICTETEKRGELEKGLLCSPVLAFIQRGMLNGTSFFGGIELITKSADIELFSVVCEGQNYRHVGLSNDDIFINISLVSDTGANPEPPVQIIFKTELEYNHVFEIPLKHEDRNVVLKANNTYRIELRSACMYFHTFTCQSSNDSFQSTESFNTRFINSSVFPLYKSPITRLNYKELDTKQSS